MGQAVQASVRAKVADGNWHTSLAKKMHHAYKGVDLHGKWELAFAMFLDRESIQWIRPKDRFDYEFEGTIRKYTPDFYLSEVEEYVEIKGFKTKKDDAKWAQFPGNLKVLRKQDLQDLLKDHADLLVMLN
jgi:hypothetical protein